MFKKIGILTYHTGYNYGASLQAYALQMMVNRLAGNSEIINFEPLRFVASREMFSRLPKRLKEMIKIASRIPYWTSLHERQNLFDRYTKECLNISALYRTEKEVIEHAGDYDCIICGSDQIWNLSQKDAPAANPLFFLNFPKKQKRISYAASFGHWVKEAPQHEDIFLPWLKQFDAVAVRETSGVDYVRSLGIDCTLTLDPTILLDEKDYDVICRERLIKEPYILMFGWNTNSDLIQAAKKVSKQLGLPVYNIVPPPRGIGSGIKRKLDVGPREFLSMIKHAEFVVTNSFHGTAFSVTYQKKFVSLISGRPDLRMQSLLGQLGLQKHFVKVEDFDINTCLNPDYSNVFSQKSDLRKTSIEYLSNALEVKND